MKKLALPVLGILSLAIIFTACQKEDSSTTTEEIETTFALSADQAVAENLVADDNGTLMEATSENRLQGQDFVSTTADRNFIGCATVTVTPANGFPKTIKIDYGTGCTFRGITRSGIVYIALSDSLRTPGATAVMTFDNYYVNLFKREGKTTWTNTSTAGTKSWSVKVEDGKTIAPDGRFWVLNSLHNTTQSAGLNTPRNPIDDEFTITGQSTIRNSNGSGRNTEIIIPLLRKNNCENIVSGRVKITAPNHYAVLDYGDGTCDRIATISINGRPPRTIILR